MPIVLKKDESDYSIGIWKSIESFEELLNLEALNQADLEKWKSFQSDKRKREWLTVRVLLRKLFPDTVLPTIRYDEYGKPFLDNEKAISISHTKEFVAILITSKAYAGIDLEAIRERITSLSAKFTNEPEEKSLPKACLVEHLHVIWGAKEVLFKLYGRGEIDFRANLFVEPFLFAESGLITASVLKNDINKKHEITYELWDNKMLTYSVSD